MAVSQSEFISITLEDRILRIKFNRPDKKNAITRDMYSTMAEAVRNSNDDSDVRVVMFEGTDGCFTSGNDLKDFMTDPNIGEGSSVGQFLSEVSTAQKPIVAAVTGMAIGIGTTVLLHCDLAYAAEKAKFSMPFVNLGLVPEFGSSLILPQLMGQRRAAELLMLGQPFGADHALDLGLVNAVVPGDEVVALALKKARALSQQPPSALRETKKLMRQGTAKVVAEQMVIEGELFTSCLTSAESAEAFSAFMEKRKPDFSKFD